jgi:hypothetical protein
LPRSPLGWATWIALAALVIIHHASIASPNGLDVFAPGFFGLTFNSMALHLLAGRFDVDPAAIGVEAFVHNGRTYAYFGIFPALLRLPLVPFFDLMQLHVERLSCLLAMLLGTAAQVAAVFAALSRAERPVRLAMLPPLLFAACLSGPAVMFARSGAIYYEAILWAWALALTFVAVALQAICGGRGFGTGRLVVLATLAGCCLLARVSTAIGLFAALGFLLAWLALRPDSGRPLMARASRALMQRRLLLPLGVLALFAAMSGFVNFERWGSPLSFGDPSEQLLILADYPDRLRMYETYGAFNLGRLPIGLIYYVFPIWIWQSGGHYWLQDWVLRTSGGFELPPSSVFLTDPLTLTLAVIGPVHLRRSRPKRPPSGSTVAVLGGLAIPALLMLTFVGLNFRYRAEFEPLLICGASVAVAGWAERLQGAPIGKLRRVFIVLAVLSVLQVVSSELHSILAIVSPFGTVEHAVPDGMYKYYRHVFDVIRGAASDAAM